MKSHKTLLTWMKSPKTLLIYRKSPKNIIDIDEISKDTDEISETISDIDDISKDTDEIANILIDIDEIQKADDNNTKITKLFRKLSWEFFDSRAYYYVMSSRKLDKKQIHLKCIPTFLIGILFPKSLDNFRPLRD